MDSTSYSGIVPTMPVTGTDSTFGGSGMWFFALIVLLLIGNGGFFGGRQQTPASQSDVVYTSAFNQLQSENSQINSNIQRAIYEVNGATKDSAYNNLGEIRDVQASIATGFANQQTCCCNTNLAIANGFSATDKAIMESRYLNAQAIADSNASLTAQITALSSKMDQNKIADLQAQVSQLQLAQATAGVVRYPNGWTYNAGTSPFCSCGGCSGNI